MTALDTREEILAEAYRIAQGQPGGVLATIHSEDATPYVTYVLFHLRTNGEVLFGSGASPSRWERMDEDHSPLHITHCRLQRLVSANSMRLGQGASSTTGLRWS